MDNENVRMVRLDPEAVAMAIIEDEFNYLFSPEAGPGEVRLRQKDLPHFDAVTLRRNLGKTLPGVSPRDTHVYVLPTPGQINTLAYETRQAAIVSLLANGHQSREVLETVAMACNRVMEMMRASKN